MIPLKYNNIEIQELKSINASSNNFFIRTNTSLSLQYITNQHQIQQLMGININFT